VIGYLAPPKRTLYSNMPSTDVTLQQWSGQTHYEADAI